MKRGDIACAVQRAGLETWADVRQRFSGAASSEQPRREFMVAVTPRARGLRSPLALRRRQRVTWLAARGTQSAIPAAWWASITSQVRGIEELLKRAAVNNKAANARLPKHGIRVNHSDYFRGKRVDERSDPAPRIDGGCSARGVELRGILALASAVGLAWRCRCQGDRVPLSGCALLARGIEMWGRRAQSNYDEPLQCGAAVLCCLRCVAPGRKRTLRRASSLFYTQGVLA
ncbi:hypothetical protein HPB51_006362 [Rhipicephalus microplus]|uniref:Uncharacterized protein n=1 Tax=Rhipicephalus microplus TaxID=6941 RepID=A0A9J6DLC4_RHIMP|nr:hypothetical protein HPB51_006362 [Rhipicephalus microplus]